MLDCSLSSRHLGVLHLDVVLNTQRLDEISMRSHHLVAPRLHSLLNSQCLAEVIVESLPLGPFGRHDLEEDGAVWVDAWDPVPCSESSCDISSSKAHPARAIAGTDASWLEAEMAHTMVATSRHQQIVLDSTQKGYHIIVMTLSCCWG